MSLQGYVIQIKSQRFQYWTKKKFTFWNLYIFCH